MNDPRPVDLAPESQPSFDIAFEVARANARYLANAERFREEQAEKHAAERADFERFAKELEKAVKRHGVVGVLSIFPDMLRDIASNDTEIEDRSEAESDYNFAADIIEAICPAVNLPYGERSSERGRKEAKIAAVLSLSKVSV